MRKIVLLLLLSLCAFPAYADDAVKPDVIKAAIKADTPYGQGTLKRLFLSIYDATVWTDAKEWSMKSPFALSMKYRLSVDSDDLMDSTVEELQKQHGLPVEHLESYKSQLKTIYPDIKSGDTLTALYVPGKGVRFFHNDKPTGTITDPEFAEHFFLIWFSPDTSEPKLRLALLGKQSG